MSSFKPFIEQIVINRPKNFNTELIVNFKIFIDILAHKKSCEC